MIGRYSRNRSTVNLHCISETIIENHPPPEIIDGFETPKVEYLDDSSSRSEAKQIRTSHVDYPASQLFANEPHEPLSGFGYSFTDETRCTPSTDSWCDDEFEKEYTKKVQGILDSIDDIMYDRRLSGELSVEMKNEIHLWAEKFPCFRIQGRQIVQPENDNIQFHSSVAKIMDSAETNFEMTQSFQVKGKQLTIFPIIEKDEYMKTESDLIDIENFNDKNEDIPTFIEEVIVQQGNYEELLAYHQIDNCDMPSQRNSSSHKSILTVANIEFITKQVTDRLMEKLWPEILSVWQTISTEQEDKHKVDSAQKKHLPSLKSPTTSSPLRKLHYDTSDLCHSLDGILTVSSKVLQKRDQRLSVELGVVTKSTLLSPHRTVPFNSLITNIQEVPVTKSLSQQTSANFPNIFYQFDRCIGREAKWPELVQDETDSLPAVVHHSTIQVHRQISEPTEEKPELKFPANHFSLPPITDNNTIFSQRQIPKSPVSPLSMIESSLDKHLNYKLLKMDKLDSRPSTCKSTQSIGHKDHIKVTVNSQPIYNQLDVPILGGLSTRLSSAYPSKSMGSHLPSLETKTSTERIVTLFPVVKSVQLLRQDDNNAMRRCHSAKKNNALNRVKK